MDKIKKASEELDLNNKTKKYLLRKYIAGIDIKEGETCVILNGELYPIRQDKNKILIKIPMGKCKKGNKKGKK